MNIGHRILMHMFGRPAGLLGRLGGAIMARMNRPFAAWVIGLLDLKPDDEVLEVGFGPGAGIELLAKSVRSGHIAGVDASRTMTGQARARNAKAIESGQVDLRYGFAENLPFDRDIFTKVLAINSMQVWPDAMAGLREVKRVMTPGGKIALGFTIHSGQSRSEVPELLAAAGFAEIRIAETEQGFCVLAVKP
ncbi:MAG TPA: class I SAM-dependent methyltransferase [Nitrosospira sp.]|nr:class I SAM-dependent methyltransferase [Nitrosospira sp.]